MSLDQMLASFGSIISTSDYVKNQVLHRDQTICNHLYFVKSGVVRTFYYKDGKDITAHIAVEQGAITAIDSFIQRKPSRYNIEVLEDATLMAVTHHDFEQFLLDNPQHERTARLFLEKIYIDLAERIEDVLFHSAHERYEKLVNQHPSIIQRVNLGHIASYLGMSQETLSRVRAQR